MRTLLGALSAVLSASLLVTMSPTADAAQRNHRPHWKHVDVETTQQFRGLAALDKLHAWVGGSDGGVWKTSNGGRTWQDVSPPGSAGLLFRDVEATDMRHVQVLAIGEADASRIYRTRDGGKTWQLTFVNDDPAAFYDCMAMFPGGKHGLAMSDPVDGKFRIISTHDFGATWHVVDPAGMPDAVPGEFAFAASGTCLVTAGGHGAWLGSGGSASRVFHSRDRGRHWKVVDSTIPAAPGGGVFSLSFTSPRRGLAVGGDLDAQENGVDMAAVTRTSGRQWTNVGNLGGYRSGVDWVAGTRETAVAVGPTGSDVTRNGGRTWTTFSDTWFDAVQCTSDGACWASGPAGSVALLAR